MGMAEGGAGILGDMELVRRFRRGDLQPRKMRCIFSKKKPIFFENS